MFYGDSFSQNSINEAEINYVFPYLIKRAPSARSEAMARTSLSELGFAPSIFLNPAGLASLENNSIFLTTGNGYYGSNNSFFLNTASVIKSKNMGNYGIGTQIFRNNNNSASKYTKITMSYSNRIRNRLDMGINFNLLHVNIDRTTSGTTKLISTIDFGILLPFEIMNNSKEYSKLNIGLSFTNKTIANDNIGGYKSVNSNNNYPSFYSGSNVNPMISTVGYNFQYHLKPLSNSENQNLNPININFTGDIFNIHDYDMKGFKIGFEATAYEIFSIRIGGYKQNLRNMIIYNDSWNHEDPNEIIGSTWSEVTYGIGFNIPLYKLSPNLRGKTISLDVVAKNQRVPRQLRSKYENIYTLFSLNFTHSLDK